MIIKMKSVSDYLMNFEYHDGKDSLLFASSEKKTITEYFEIEEQKIPKYVNEFWTSKQRKANSIHEISYRACFKPQLPHFFIKLLTKEKDLVYDPFSGRGTTGIEAGLLNRNVILNDANPLSEIISQPRFFVPKMKEIENRLHVIPMVGNARAEIDLSMFYDEKTEAEIVSIRNYLKARKERGEEDEVDKWIRMVATNRLTGHSAGFFSVYTLPPNQAISPERQAMINKEREQRPEYRNTVRLILRKTKSLVKDLKGYQKEVLRRVGEAALFLCKDARETSEIETESVQLTVTSPPFLNVVQYSKDNWLRCWFNSIDDKEIEKRITMSRTIEDWSKVMSKVFVELWRITKHGGWVAFEVGEIRKGTIKLDEYVVPLGMRAGFSCEGIVINLQSFTKTSNIWGVNNMALGTNTNRIVLFRK
jgi:DNA modification methylase